MDESTWGRKQILYNNDLGHCKLGYIYGRMIGESYEFFYIDKNYYYHSLTIVRDLRATEGHIRHYIKDAAKDPNMGWIDFKAEIVWGFGCYATQEDCEVYLRSHFGKPFKSAKINIRR